MSAAEELAHPTVLIVSAAGDEAIGECDETLRGCGAVVESAPNVYAAMARLSRGLAAQYLVVDIRNLDEYELRFIELAPRYHRRVVVLVPLLDGTAERSAGLDGRFPLLPVQDLIDTILGVRLAATAEAADATDVVEWSGEDEDSTACSTEAEAPATEAPIGPGEGLTYAEEALSAVDAGPAAHEPSLHDAVRQRMAAEAAEPVVRRAPPDGQAAGSPFEAPGIGADSPVEATRLSPEEVDALVRDEPPSSDSGRPPQAGETEDMR